MNDRQLSHLIFDDSQELRDDGIALIQERWKATFVESSRQPPVVLKT
jgi:hypothetical protein